MYYHFFDIVISIKILYRILIYLQIYRNMFENFISIQDIMFIFFMNRY